MTIQITMFFIPFFETKSHLVAHSVLELVEILLAHLPKRAGITVWISMPGFGFVVVFFVRFSEVGRLTLGY